MEAKSSSLLTSFTNTLTSFLALYLTTLFSLDAYAAARNSPFRPSSSITQRPIAPSGPSEYQAGMHGRGRRGGGDVGSRGGGHVAGMRDNRAPVGMGVTAGCGACMT